MTDDQLQRRLDAAHNEMRKWRIIWKRDHSNTAFCHMQNAEGVVVKLETELRKREGTIA